MENNKIVTVIKSIVLLTVVFFNNTFYFSAEESLGREDERPYRIAQTNTFGKPDWFDFVAKEYEACRETVGLCDYSSFTKIDLTVSFTSPISNYVHTTYLERLKSRGKPNSLSVIKLMITTLNSRK